MASDKSGLEAPARLNRRQAPATERNRGPILSLLREVMPTPGTILEVASGTGQHGAWFAAAFPEHRWAASDLDPGALAGIDAWGQDAPAGNILPSRRLDATDEDWPVLARQGHRR